MGGGSPRLQARARAPGVFPPHASSLWRRPRRARRVGHAPRQGTWVPHVSRPAELRRCALGARARAGVARKLAAVRSFHDHLTRTGAAPQNPAELLPMPKKESRLPRVLAPDDIARLLDRIPASRPLEVRDRAMLEVTYACGLRAEEIINLDDDSVDFDSEALRVTGKGSKTRIVPMGEPAQRALDRYLRQ